VRSYVGQDAAAPKLTTTRIVDHLAAMQLLFKRPVAVVLLIALTLVLIGRGIVPAMSKIDSDFPNYFTAAKIVANAGDSDRLYDNSWFQEQARHYRIGSGYGTKFSPFPPPTALLLLPLTRFEPLTALRVVTGLSLLCLIASIVLLMRILCWSGLDTAVFVLLSGYAICTALRFGQPYIVVSTSCVLGYYAYLNNRPSLAGICLGLFSPIKYFPVVMLIYFAFRKQWRLLVAGLATILVEASVSIGVLGWGVHREFLSSVLGNHMIGNLSMQDPFTAAFQSFDTLFRRLFIFDPSANPQPFIALPALQLAGLITTKALLLLAAMVTLVKLARQGTASATAASIGLLGVLTLLIAPATSSYYLVLLWLPVGLLIEYFIRARIRLCAYFILGDYALIGFFPYRFTEPFEGRGGLSVLAYPRLFLLLAMFVVCVAGIWSRQAPPARPAAT
jgi:hypothetical protein